MSFSKEARRKKIATGIRGKISGTAERPRLSVFRSNKEIYAQLIDDDARVTLAAASSRDKEFAKTGTKVDQSKAVGTQLAKVAIEKGISSVVFDRNGFLYHGRIKALADGAREGGLQF